MGKRGERERKQEKKNKNKRESRRKIKSKGEIERRRKIEREKFYFLFKSCIFKDIFKAVHTGRVFCTFSYILSTQCVSDDACVSMCK